MFRYSICFIIGILLYILLNRRNGFSVGIPPYRVFNIKDTREDMSKPGNYPSFLYTTREDALQKAIEMGEDYIYIDLGEDLDEDLDEAADHPPPKVSPPTKKIIGGAASADNLEVRMAFEIETCFANKLMPRKDAVCPFINSDGSKKSVYDSDDPSAVEFLNSTHADNSLFKGVPEITSQCKNRNDYCRVELIINPKRLVLFDGNNFDVEESEFKTSIQDWLKNNITSCGKPATGDPNPNPNSPEDGGSKLSTCGVHLHISVPSLETYKDYIKELFKILVFYIWFTEYQDMLKSDLDLGNPYYVTVGWNDAPYIPWGKQDFPLPTASQIKIMVSDPDSNKELIHTFANTLPGQNYIGRGERVGDRGDKQSNVIVVDKRFGDQYPHFEFRGHYDLMLAIGSFKPTEDKVNKVYTHLKEYTRSIWMVLDKAYEMLK